MSLHGPTAPGPQPPDPLGLGMPGQGHGGGDEDAEDAAQVVDAQPEEPCGCSCGSQRAEAEAGVGRTRCRTLCAEALECREASSFLWKCRRRRRRRRWRRPPEERGEQEQERSARASVSAVLCLWWGWCVPVLWLGPLVRRVRRPLCRAAPPSSPTTPSSSWPSLFWISVLLLLVAGPSCGTDGSVSDPQSEGRGKTKCTGVSLRRSLA